MRVITSKSPMSIHNEFTETHTNIINGRATTIRGYVDNPFDDSIVKIRGNTEEELEEVHVQEFFRRIQLLRRFTITMSDDDAND